MLDSSFDCFYPLTSCSSSIKPLPSRKPLQKNASAKKIGASSGKKITECREQGSCNDSITRARSPSKSRERHRKMEATEKQMEGRALRKRVGMAFKRPTDSIVTKDKTIFLAAQSLDEQANRSDETYTAASVSGSSSDDISSSTDSKESTEVTDRNSFLNNRRRSCVPDAKSITTEDMEKKHHNSFSWCSWNVTKRANVIPTPTSPTDSVGAVKRSIRSKFDYIRKNQRFANPYPDPPADMSVVTSKSIIAKDAGSLLRRRCHKNDAAKTTGQRVKKNELVKKILQQRKKVAFRPGRDP